ncbi:MAG: hypothetical protein E6G12_00550 [Actinobacteria bacterium]|nr:MAG: hypothetical protein E6G12_00550 [Actinomycetota bacterium]
MGRRSGAAGGRARPRRVPRPGRRGGPALRVARLPVRDGAGEILPATTRRRVFAGYTGWGVGQLEAELADEDWILEPALADDAFTEDPEELWRDVLRRKGGIYELVARMPEDPRVN